jgi:hypothetical protein
MQPLVGIGGISIRAEVVHALERRLDGLCKSIGFPPKQPFKWSPGKDMWMRENLVDDKRQAFFLEVLGILRGAGARAIGAISWTTCRPATKTAKTPEQDVVNLTFERVQHLLTSLNANGIVIADRPSGARAEEEKFLSDCIDTMQEGAGYIVPDRISVVVSSPAKNIRLLQAADILISCTTAYVAGEYTHSPAVFESGIRPMLYSDGGRIGGIGLKLHPQYRLINLHHWLLGDEFHWRVGVGYPLPMKGFPYATSADAP